MLPGDVEDVEGRDRDVTGDRKSYQDRNWLRVERSMGAVSKVLVGRESEKL